MRVKFTDIGTAAAAEQLDLTGNLGFLLYRGKASVAVLNVMIGYQNIIYNLYKIFCISAAGADNASSRFTGWDLYCVYRAHIDLPYQAQPKVLRPDIFFKRLHDYHQCSA
jgi:hypothetical protein